MKASRFAAAFLEELDKWEKALSHISETVEMMMGVQRKWMYLESIFVGSEDIRKQLPSRVARSSTTSTPTGSRRRSGCSTPAPRTRRAHRRACSSAHRDGRHARPIQKSLDEYLETKRQAFPRFYFLSNDDLLEILGQARDPLAVQPHVRKCFEAIKTLDMKEVGKEGAQGLRGDRHQVARGEYVKLEDDRTRSRARARSRCGCSRGDGDVRDARQGHVPLLRRHEEDEAREVDLLVGGPADAHARGQIAWTVECTKALHARCRRVQKGAMRRRRRSR